MSAAGGASGDASGFDGTTRDDTETAPREELARIVAGEIAGSASPAARALAAEIRRRHGAAVSAVLYYGSCLRTRAGASGVHDFYVLVDRYLPAYRGSARAHGRRRGFLRAAVLSLANRALPPNVFYLELPFEDAVLRAKYAVISRRDFLRAAGPRYLHSMVWARFSQPFLALEVRDEATRAVIVDGAVRSVETLCGRLLPLLPAAAAGSRMPTAFAWEHIFRETYRAELRTELQDTGARLYASAHDRFDRVASLALRSLARRGRLRLDEDGAFLRLRVSPWRRRIARLSWFWRRRVAKALAITNLVKTAFTFGNWVPYALWKIERHTGARVVTTERQRRHPMVFGWPVLLRLLRQRDLR